MTSIEGVVPIMHTPFDEQDEIDWGSFQREIDWAIERGIQGCAIGMVSKVLRLTFDERRELTEKLVAMVSGRVVTIASAGAESTRQAIEHACHV